jgi:hypothetical protein
MKILITLILPLLLVNGIYAQEGKGTVTPPVNEVAFSNIVQVENTSKEELHKRARKWAAYNCDAITLDDDGEIVGHGIIFLNKMDQNDISYTIKLKVKDNRYKYEILNLRVKARYYNNNVAIVEYPLEDYSMIGKANFDKAVKEELNRKLIALLDKAMKTSIDENW